MLNQPLFQSLMVVGYAASTFAYLLQLIFDDRAMEKWGWRILAGTVSLQTLFLLFQHLPPFHSFAAHGEGDFYYTASWILGLLFLGVKRLHGWGIFFVLLMTILMILALTHPHAYHVGGRVATNPWALIHFLFMSLAFALFALSFIIGIGFLIQRSFLKHHQESRLSLWLPPLEVADDIHAKVSTLGFLVLSAGMVAGAVLSKQTVGLFFTSDRRQVAALFIWILYAIFLKVRVKSGWHGRKGILLSILGFVVVILASLAMQHKG